ncbi:uncharacterized protein EI97DRAFT_56966 [Westerdykella ornata]|uniref:Uncharacterized protein n=1 Tax=Westerdykella ornata TaxID=318751 RepID=A0A6A6JIB2_WESOR|nr:uncharacterized protein EI97DRAFT_56966 [Westerdykella ornata]KAF2275823.1 hypothetical protein EI97DRAFT_56966 [Westerdykella ornata]
MLLFGIHGIRRSFSSSSRTDMGLSPTGRRPLLSTDGIRTWRNRGGGHGRHGNPHRKRLSEDSAPTASPLAAGGQLLKTETVSGGSRRWGAIVQLFPKRFSLWMQRYSKNHLLYAAVTDWMLFWAVS